MNFIVLTIFPDLFTSFWDHGIVRRAVDRGLISAFTMDIRDYARGRHRVTDDRPYGGGAGMVFKPEPLSAAISAARQSHADAKTILLSPQGRVLDQDTVAELSSLNAMILVCGRYEGIDERICQNEIDEEISIGDYILTGGEIAAMVLMDAVTRLLPGALGCKASAEQDSFSNGLLDCAHYTRPREYKGQRVPETLLSGNHQQIERWRLESALTRTFLKRRDLLRDRQLTKQELDILNDWYIDLGNLIQSQSLHCPDSLPGG